MSAPGNPDGSRLQDLMTRSASNADELHLQILTQIRDNLTVQGKNLAELGKTAVDMQGRLIRLEERDHRITQMEKQFEKLDARVDVLLKDKDRRDGAISAWTWLLKNWPSIIAMLVTIGAVLVVTGKV